MHNSSAAASLDPNSSHLLAKQQVLLANDRPTTGIPVPLVLFLCQHNTRKEAFRNNLFITIFAIIQFEIIPQCFCFTIFQFHFNYYFLSHCPVSPPPLYLLLARPLNHNICSRGAAEHDTGQLPECPGKIHSSDRSRSHRVTKSSKRNTSHLQRLLVVVAWNFPSSTIPLQQL